MPALKSIVGAVQKVVDWLNSLDEGTKKVIVTVALVAGAYGNNHRKFCNRECYGAYRKGED